MNKITCFDVTSMVVDEAARQFEPLWVIDHDRYNALKSFCKDLDTLAEYGHCLAFEAAVDEITKEVTIGLEYVSLVLSAADTQALSILQRFGSVRFDVTQETNLMVEFKLPSLWNFASWGHAG